MVDNRATFIRMWNRLNSRNNDLIEEFTLDVDKFHEFQVNMMKINELKNDDAEYYGFGHIKEGELIQQ